MANLTSGQRQYLRKLAHEIKPTAMVGKNGLTEQVVAAVDQELVARELIKVKFLEYQDQRQSLAATLVEETGSVLVALIGNTAIIYRQSMDPEQRRVELPEA